MSVPILRLRLAGYCGSLTDGLTCGAISDTEEQKTLQDAACSMQAVPILWYRKVRERKALSTSPKKLAKRVMKPGNQPLNGSPKNVAAFKEDTLFKLQPKNSTLNAILTEEEEEELYYAGIEAVMSICDSEEGPVLEIKAHGLQFSIFQNNYEIIDIDPKYDLISSFLLEKNQVGQDFLERTIPLSDIYHASPGGHWDWKNMINMKSGNCDCAVKVYGVPPDDALVGSGKKLLLFDVLHSTSISSEINRDKLIESLNVLLVWNKEQMELEKQVLDSTKASEKKIEDIISGALCC